MSSRSFFQSYSVDDTPAGNVYPTAGGGTLGQRASAMSPATLTTRSGNGAGASGSDNAAPRGGLLGQPLTWWGLLFAMLLGLMWFAQRSGNDGDFGNIRMSAYNVLTISLAAIIGIGFFKALFGTFRVAGLSEFVEAV